MIRLDAVSKQYQYQQGYVLDSVSIDIDSGLSTLLVDVQSGKSTIAKLILGLDSATSGTVTVLDVAPGQNHDIALLTDNLLLWDNRNVLYNLMYPLLVRKVPRQQARDRATMHAQRCGIAHLLHSKVSKLEQSDRVMVAVARATIRPLQLIVVDSLDSVCNGTMWHNIIDMLTAHCSNVLVLTSNCSNAVGSVHILHNNAIIHSGNSHSASLVLADTVWLFDRLGGSNE